ncbi:MAG: transposase, partial [Chloroflexota bacterium]|nr:transposase [Chloroflexota bacterium]
MSLPPWTNSVVSWARIRAATTPAGYAALVRWAEQFGTLVRVGIEGTGSYGAGLARWLRARGHVVVEVERPKRQTRRRNGKSDPIDAEAAARAVQAGTATGQPKTGDGPIEMIRSLQAVRRSALKARTQAANQLHALVINAPDVLRGDLRGSSLPRLVARAAAFRASLRLPRRPQRPSLPSSPSLPVSTALR